MKIFEIHQTLYANRFINQLATANWRRFCFELNRFLTCRCFISSLSLSSALWPRKWASDSNVSFIYRTAVFWLMRVDLCANVSHFNCMCLFMLGYSLRLFFIKRKKFVCMHFSVNSPLCNETLNERMSFPYIEIVFVDC